MEKNISTVQFDLTLLTSLKRTEVSVSAINTFSWAFLSWQDHFGAVVYLKETFFY